jgi:predicted acyl esterase
MPVEENLSVRMRDGVDLAMDVHFPSHERPAAPVLLIRTPYGKSDEAEQPVRLARYLSARGFTVAVQDLRGTGRSDGSFKAYSRIEGPDGWDTLDWLVAQPWCSGKIGTVGCSYHGEVQDMLAALRHPNHTAAFIEGAYTYNDGTMRAFSFVRNGVVELAYAVGGDRDLLRTLPLSHIRPGLPRDDASYYARHWPDTVHAWLTRDSADAYWDDDGGLGDDSVFDVPAIHMNEWYSVPFSSIRMFDLYRKNAPGRQAREHQYLILSPMTHCGTSRASRHTVVGERDLGDARFPYYETMVDWFRYWLYEGRGGRLPPAKVQAYAMGKNVWQQFDTWPPSGARHVELHLAADRTLRLEDAEMHSGSQSFVYDPDDPVPSVGGPVNAGSVLVAGGFDQRAVEQRADVLTWSTPALEHPVQVSGRVQAVLHVSSSAVDTDFTAKLVDVYPDGRAYNVLEGILRMRFRESPIRPVPMSPSRRYEIRIDLDSTSNWFGRGHRIRLEISSSNFPRFDRNLNTGVSGAWDVRRTLARNTVHYGGSHPSRLILPVLDERGMNR